jgi:para-aminobenzoate synthetase/4-amino-4-deoxychorismate lyase
MEIIRELEAGPRGVYCGAIGHFAPDGSAAFNVAIRTLTISGNAGSLGVGSAVVADSRAEDEFDECLLKARYYAEARPPIGLIETMRFEPGAGILRSALHLDRIGEAAQRFGIPVDEAAAMRAIEEALAGADEPRRVRLTLSEEGKLEATAAALALTDDETVWTYIVSERFVPSGDMLARHKTNWRARYDSERAAANAAGVDEVLYVNERDEIAEGAATNVFARLDGRLFTPPLSAGALAGCLRRSLLESGECAERSLTLSDLESAEEIYFGNSVRGLVRARRAAQT